MARPRKQFGQDEAGLVAKAILSQLEERRWGSGISQAQIAKMVGVNQSSVCRWERGKDEITLTKFIRYAKALGFDITEDCLSK